MRCLLLAPLLFALVSCESTGMSSSHPEQWQTSEVTTASERVLWEVTVLSLEKQDFPMGTGVDPTTMEATSGWRNNLAPFRRFPPSRSRRAIGGAYPT